MGEGDIANFKIEDKPKPVLKRELDDTVADDSTSAKIQRGLAENLGDTKLLKTESQSIKTEAEAGGYKNDQKDEIFSTEKQLPLGVSTDDFKLFNDMQNCRGPIKNLVLFKMGNEVALSQLNRLSSIWKRPFRLANESLGQGNWHAKVIFDGFTWSETWGQRKAARQVAGEAALWNMNQYFYVVEMRRQSIEGVFFNRSKLKSKVSGDYITNLNIPPSNKDDPPDTDIDFSQIAPMRHIAQLDNPNLFHPPKDENKIFVRLKALVDEYKKDEADTCELVFVRQYPLPVYMPIMDYAHKVGLKAKYVGSGKDRMLVVYKAAAVKKPWQFIWNLVILGRKNIDGLKIHPPKSLRPPNSLKGVKLRLT